MAAGTVSPKSETSLTAMMLETLSVVTKTATTIGYQRPVPEVSGFISRRSAGRSRRGRSGAVFGFDGDADAAPNGEGAAHAAPARFERRYDIVEDLVGHVFVKNAFVPVGPQVELEGFRLEDARPGHVLDGDRGEIRLSGGRAHAGELVALQSDQVVPLGMVVGKGLQLLGGRAVSAEPSQAFEIGSVGHPAAGCCAAARRARTLSQVRQKAQASGALVGWPQRRHGWRPSGASRTSIGKAPLRFASRNDR